MDELRTLPETARLPCAKTFAVCINTGTRQTTVLPSVRPKTHGKTKAHDKLWICRVPIQKTLGKEIHTAICTCSPCARLGNTQQTRTHCKHIMFAMCLALGPWQTDTAADGHQRLPCATSGTRQIIILPCACSYAHSKIFKIYLILPSQLFLPSTYSTCYCMLSFSMFFDLFAIFGHFILLNRFLVDKLNLNCKCFE